MKNSINKAIENLIIKDEKDLLNKLQKGMKDLNERKVCSVEEAFEEVQEIIMLNF